LAFKVYLTYAEIPNNIFIVLKTKNIMFSVECLQKYGYIIIVMFFIVTWC